MSGRDYRLLHYFAAVAEAGSIRGAARRLGISAPVVSTALADLEAQLGRSLVRRDRRRCALTVDGQMLYDATCDMMVAVDRAFSVLAQDRRDPAGDLSITLPTELCATWLPPILARFESRYPRIRITIHASDEAVSLPSSSHDLAIRASYSLRRRATALMLDSLPLALVAAPSWIAQPVAQVPLIAFAHHPKPGELAALDPNGRECRLALVPRVFVNNNSVARELALAGLGAALLLEASVAPDLDAGRLVKLLPDHELGHVLVQLLLRDRLPSAAARAFARFVEVPRASSRAG